MGKRRVSTFLRKLNEKACRAKKKKKKYIMEQK